MESNIKVLHLVAGDLSSGAARGAFWLHKGLLTEIDSKLMVSGRSFEDDSSVISLSATKSGRIKSIIRSNLDSIPLRFYKSRTRNIFSTGLVGFNFTKTAEYKHADIIHLHWVNAGLVNIKHLSKIKKPIIWTLRDMWPFTGGCHYSLDCEKYKTGCGACPQLGSSNPKDLSRLVLNHKQKFIPQNLTAVGISHWLTDEAKKSLLFKDHACLTILNNIDTDEFQKINKSIARQILGITTKKQIILCGSTKLKDFYKGFQKYLDALQHLDTEKTMLCFFGRFDKTLIEQYSFEYKSFGYLNDNISLNLVYAAADVFVAPSIQEAFGKTLAESQCSGTPVVCFDASGPKDLVEHKVTGYKAEPFSSEDLANGINWILQHEHPEQLAQAARDKVLREFDSQVVAQKYIGLYNHLLKGDV